LVGLSLTNGFCSERLHAASDVEAGPAWRRAQLGQRHRLVLSDAICLQADIMPADLRSLGAHHVVERRDRLARFGTEPIGTPWRRGAGGSR